MLSNNLIAPRRQSGPRYGRFGMSKGGGATIPRPRNIMSRFPGSGVQPGDGGVTGTGGGELPWQSKSKSVSSSRSGILNTEAKGVSDQQFGAAANSLRSSRKNVGAMEAKRLANINRTYDQLMKMLAQQGRYERGRIGRDFDAQAGSVGSALAGTGLYNTTVQGNMRQGVERNRAEALLGLEESLRAQRAGAMAEQTQLSDAALAQSLSADTQYGATLAELLARQASTLPMSSRQDSTSESIRY